MFPGGSGTASLAGQELFTVQRSQKPINPQISKTFPWERDSTLDQLKISPDDRCFTNAPGEEKLLTITWRNSCFGSMVWSGKN